MSRELEGVRVVVTRAARQASGLIEGLAAHGANAVLLPLLEVIPPEDPRPLERAASELALYDWLVLTSANAVESLFERSGGAAPARLRVAAVGEATARALRDYDIEPALIADQSRAEGLAADLAPHVSRRRRVLLPQAEDARPMLAELLEAAGAEVVRVTAYRKRAPEGAADRARALFATRPWGWVTFTSPSTVHGLVGALGAQWTDGEPTLDAASIGPVTSEALRSFGTEPTVEAGSPSAASLVESIVAAVARRTGA
jgi:uroporphyrinogen-III synthase